MPRNTRNAWVRLRIDGRTSRLEGGPARKDGGLEGLILLRESGGVSDAKVYIDVRADDHYVTLRVEPQIPKGFACGGPEMLETVNGNPVFVSEDGGGFAFRLPR